MRHVDPSFPLFVLVGLMVGETYYAKTLVPRVKALKLKYFGRTDVVLHSRDIRRREGAFSFFRNDQTSREAFNADVATLFTAARVRLFAIAIDKPKLLRRSLFPLNPYDVSLSQLLSVVCGPPRTPTRWRPTIARIVAESRGRREDKELQREYQSLRSAGIHSYGSPDVQARLSRTVQLVFPDRVDFVTKANVVAGLELADLAAYPITRALISNAWDRADAQVILRKLKELIRFP